MNNFKKDRITSENLKIKKNQPKINNSTSEIKSTLEAMNRKLNDIEEHTSDM